MKFPIIFRSRHESIVAQMERENASIRNRAESDAEKNKRKLHSLKEECANTWAHIAPLEKLIGQLREESELQQSEITVIRSSRMQLLDKLTDLLPPMQQDAVAPIPVVIGIDVEPDKRTIDLTDPSWRGAIRLFERLPEFRQMLRESTRHDVVPLNWFPRADPQVEVANGDAAWALKKFADEWQIVSDAGDEIGLHMHPWRWDKTNDCWSQDHADEAWLIHCLRSSIAAYRDFFGSTPASYRGGDRFLSNLVVKMLEEEGVEVDLTLERMPGVVRLVESERGTGSIPDGTSLPSRAYRASVQDFKQPNEKRVEGLGMLPLTAYEEGSLYLWLPNTQFEENLELLLEAKESPTHLAFVVRTDIAESSNWDHFVENALSLARRVRKGQLVFTTATEAWKMAAPKLFCAK